MTEHVDVLIVGGGLSGIGAASHIQRDLPGKSLLILESRAAIGGTWDLFRYPGIRSDSYMYTLGYSFRPWTDGKAIADGESIRQYIVDTVQAEGLASRIRTNHRVVSAEWSTATAVWTVTAVRTGSSEYAMDAGSAQTDSTALVSFTCSFLFVCSGYYRYDEGFTPAIPGIENYAGTVVHPQHWPADLDYAGKRVVIIGSGATAVTLVPSMARSAEHVTMLQRSPTYISPVPTRDRLADRLRGRLPAQLAYNIIRVKNIAYSIVTYQLSRRRPELMKSMLRQAAVDKLPAGFAVDTHLAPTYQPWDQRLCAIPDGDLYQAISDGVADIVTDRIEQVTEGGLRLSSGAQLDADVIITATGLNLLVMGGMKLAVDGRAIDAGEAIAYKGMMLDGVPNFALTLGYTNASWTLKADLVARYVGRLLRRMDRHGYDIVTPQVPDAVRKAPLAPLFDLQAGYIQRSIEKIPKQGQRTPWRLRQNYVRDFLLLRAGTITDDVRFDRRDDRDLLTTSSSAIQDALVLPGTSYLTAGGLRLRYRDTGDGPPLLLLHGIGQSLEDWNEQHDRLSLTHRVISLDLPGFAYSQRPKVPATLQGLAKVLPDFLDALEIADPVGVIGNSLGGAVAMSFAVAHPRRVSSLVLANSAGFGKDVTIALRLLAVKPIGARLIKPTIANSTRTLQSIFHNQSLATEERIAHAFTLAQRPEHAATLLDIAQDLGTFRGVRPEWREKLLRQMSELDIPVLVVWGDSDQVLPSHHLRAAIASLPHAKTHVFAETGHMPQIERPDQFAALVQAFLASCAETTSMTSREGASA
ncbi:MAG TPA: alpha/beta fold hydrolase [Tepidisphaeraceae bacterium]|nr:alpha/beta fold hydrolase [Tepidisphaeraceae bacterium]